MKVWVGGMRAAGSGYPNAVNTLRILRDLGSIEIVDLGQELPEQMHLWRLAQARPASKIVDGMKLLFGNLVSAVNVLTRTRGAKVWVYVPYPSVFFMLWLSMVPARWRPRCIADAYISMWDAAFRDRSGPEGQGLVSKLVRAAESRALRACHLVLADTTAHREMFINEFGLRPSQVDAVPLALPAGSAERNSEPKEEIGSNLRILFVGTFIPLHGIDAILEGVTQFLNEPGLEFRFIGHGQDARTMSSFIENHSSASISWEQGWLGVDKIRDEIRQADICIGVFGGENKAARVLPLKLYHYLAAGKPVITQAAYSLPADVPSLDGVVVLSSRSTMARDLKAVINDAKLRSRLGAAAASYFQLHLSDAAIARRWKQLLGQ